MIGREKCKLGYRSLCIERDRGCEPLFCALGCAHEFGMLNLVRQIDLEPVGRLKLRDITLYALARQVLHRLGEFVLCDRQALSAVNFRESAGEYRLGLVVKRTDELRFPAVPDTRTDRPDIGGGENSQQL